MHAHHSLGTYCSVHSSWSRRVPLALNRGKLQANQESLFWNHLVIIRFRNTSCRRLFSVHRRYLIPTAQPVLPVGTRCFTREQEQRGDSSFTSRESAENVVITSVLAAHKSNKTKRPIGVHHTGEHRLWKPGECPPPFPTASSLLLGRFGLRVSRGLACTSSRAELRCSTRHITEAGAASEG